MHHQQQRANHETSEKNFNTLVKNIRWLLGLKSLQNIVLDNESGRGQESPETLLLILFFLKLLFFFTFSQKYFVLSKVFGCYSVFILQLKFRRGLVHVEESFARIGP